MREFTLPEQAPFTGILDPAADAAGRTGRWVSCKTSHKMYLIAYINQGSATAVTLNIQQATNVSGGSAKNITNNVRIWACVNIGSTDLLVRQTDATSVSSVVYTTDTGTNAKIIVFEIDPATLDLTNSFVYVTLITGASSASNITSAIAVSTPARYEGTNPPSLLL